MYWSILLARNKLFLSPSLSIEKCLVCCWMHVLHDWKALSFLWKPQIVFSSCKIRDFDHNSLFSFRSPSLVPNLQFTFLSKTILFHRSYLTCGSSLVANRLRLLSVKFVSMAPEPSSKPASSSISSATTNTDYVDIEDLHLHAVRRGETTYIDPTTGFMSFTELAHLQRGVCCGRQCRHCPYGWVNVPDPTIRREPKVSCNANFDIIQKMNPDSKSRILQPSLTSVSSSTSTLTTNPSPTLKSGGRNGGKLTKKNVPYTRKGDGGTSQLLTGERRPKDDLAFEAMGTVDELCSVVGLAYAELIDVTMRDCNAINNDNKDNRKDYGKLESQLVDIMSRLFDIGSHVAKPKKVLNDNSDSDSESDSEEDFQSDGIGGGFDPSHIEDLEHWIDLYTEELPELLSFILPTGSKLAAQLHVARTVCRRAERRCVKLVEDRVCDPHALKYLNRLSDFFFLAARFVNHKDGKPDLLYQLPYRGATQRQVIDSKSKS
jgi:cob(I)alamin adenosyltransferase